MTTGDGVAVEGRLLPCDGVPLTAESGVLVGDCVLPSGDGILPVADSPPVPSLSSPAAKEISNRDAVGNVGGGWLVPTASGRSWDPTKAFLPGSTGQQ